MTCRGFRPKRPRGLASDRATRNGHGRDDEERRAGGYQRGACDGPRRRPPHCATGFLHGSRRDSVVARQRRRTAMPARIIATPTNARVGTFVAVLGARAPSRNSGGDSMILRRSVAESGPGGIWVSALVAATAESGWVIPVSGRRERAAAAESTHCFISVSVTRAMLSCAASARRAVSVAFAAGCLGGAITVVICASARATPNMMSAAPAARASRLSTDPPECHSPRARRVPAPDGPFMGREPALRAPPRPPPKRPPPDRERARPRSSRQQPENLLRLPEVCTRQPLPRPDPRGRSMAALPCRSGMARGTRPARLATQPARDEAGAAANRPTRQACSGRPRRHLARRRPQRPGAPRLARR